MGCDWIEYRGSLIGYGIEYSTIFSNTKYDIDEFKSYYASCEDIDSEEEEPIDFKYDSERCSFGLSALKQEWSKYLYQFHPLVDKETIPEFDIICESFSGTYESVGYRPTIVWGHNIEDPDTNLTQTDQLYEKIGMEFVFPRHSKEIFTDFMAIFRTKICESSTSDELKLKKLIKDNTSFRIFGSL